MINTQAPGFAIDAGSETYQTAVQALESLQARRFRDLDGLFAELRSPEQVDAAGFWMLPRLYATLDCPQQQLPFNWSGLMTCFRYYRNPELPWLERLAQLQAWLNAEPQSVAAPIALADCLVGFGWQARGSGRADTVTEQGWHLLGERLEAARQMLQDHAEPCRNDPQWHLVMLRVALGQGWDHADFDACFLPASQQFPTFLELYYAKLTYLMPKWHGDVDLLVDFIDAAVRHTYPTLGYALYPLLVFACRREFSDHIAAMDVDWTRMQRGFRDLLRRYPNYWTVNLYLIYAYLFDDKDTTRELLPIVKKHFHKALWQQVDLLFYPVKMWARRP